MSTLSGYTKIIDQSPVENPFSGMEIRNDAIALSQGNDNQKTTQLTPEDPSLEQELWDNRVKLKELTAQYAICYLDPKIKKRFYSQIDWLLNSEQWEYGDNLANIDSFKTLIKFILNANPYDAPYLGLSDSGNLLASWIKGDNKVTLECLSQDRVHWFVSCVFNEKRERVSGEAPSLGRLLATLKPFENAGWFKY